MLDAPPARACTLHCPCIGDGVVQQANLQSQADKLLAPLTLAQNLISHSSNAILHPACQLLHAGQWSRAANIPPGTGTSTLTGTHLCGHLVHLLSQGGHLPVHCRCRRFQRLDVTAQLAPLALHRVGYCLQLLPPHGQRCYLLRARQSAGCMRATRQNSTAPATVYRSSTIRSALQSCRGDQHLRPARWLRDSCCTRPLLYKQNLTHLCTLPPMDRLPSPCILPVPPHVLHLSSPSSILGFTFAA